MHPIAPAPLAMMVGLGWMLRTGSSSSATAVFALVGMGTLLLFAWSAIIGSMRVLSDREHPLQSATPMTAAAPGATRFTGGAVFAVDGHRLNGSYPFGEIVIDGAEATIRLRGPLPGLRGERVIRRDQVEAVLVSRWRSVPYVEFVDDVRKHGLTRFYGGKNLVRALADRGWPIPEGADPSAPSDAGGRRDSPRN